MTVDLWYGGGQCPETDFESLSQYQKSWGKKDAFLSSDAQHLAYFNYESKTIR